MDTLSYHTRFSISSLKTLECFAIQLSDFLKPGDTVALDGPLGAGKTTLSQKLTHALGVQEQASSPTFVLMHEYTTGPFPVVHVDLYRLGEERADSLAEELFSIADAGNALLLVEWAKYGQFLSEILTVSIAIRPDSDHPETRLIEIAANRPLFEFDESEGIG